MKRLVLSLLCSLLALTKSLEGGAVQPCLGEFAIQAEYLYWHALFDQSFYVFRENGPSNATAIGHRYENPMRWHSGVRLEAIYETCECGNELDLRWTRFHVSNRHKVSGIASHPLIPTQGHPFFTHTTNTFAQSDLRFNFDAGEFLFWSACINSSANIVLKGGLNYTYIGFKELLQYTQAGSVHFTTIEEKTSFWGLGPECALDLRFPLSRYLPNCLSWIPICFHGDMRASLLVSRSRAIFNEIDNLTSTGNATVTHMDAKNDPAWRLVPVWDIRFGFSTEYACKCCSVAIEIGYELLSYHQAIQTTSYPSGTAPGSLTNNATISFDIYGNLDFHGPYLSIGIAF